MGDPDPSITASPHHKSLHRYETFLGLRFLTCSCYRRLPLFNDEWVRHEFVTSLVRTRDRHGFVLIAWVLMPEHFHLLLIPRLPESPVDAVLNMLKSTMSRRVLAQWRADDSPVIRGIAGGRGTLRFWQPGGGYDRNVRGDRPLRDLVTYIHEDPVRRGLVASSTKWPWSSARQCAGLTQDPPHIDDSRAFREMHAHRLTASFGSLSAVASAMKERFGGL
jgi:putative transposase